MIIESYNGKSYLDETSITSMTIVGDYQFENGRHWKNEDEKSERVYSIWCNSVTNNVISDTLRLVFKTAKEAEYALLEIVKQIETNKKSVKSVEEYSQKDNKGYIEGFKEGAEYALKLSVKDSK